MLGCSLGAAVVGAGAAAAETATAGETDAAVELFRQSIVLVPDSAEFHEDLAEALYLSGDTRASARIFDLALRLRLERKG